MKFEEFGLSPELLSAVKKHGYDEATPIQEKTIPLIIQGVDVIGQAQTGTGKTAAFGLPILEEVDPKNPQIQALVISPTRELAMQTEEELNKLGSDKHVKTQVVFGGYDIRRQIHALKEHPQILVGTPGRLIDHLNRHTIDFRGVKTLVIDEADEMLNMGFLEDIETIVHYTPDDRQTLLFSATMPDDIKKIGVKFMEDPEEVHIASKGLTIDLVDQYLVNTREYEKFDAMTRLFDVEQPELAIVFGRTKRRVDELTKALRLRGYKAAGIHGDLDQAARMRTLRSFKKGELQFLVATDVAARGLDISGVTHVYNYDVPQDPESYVHRIGRTGRAGHHGVSVTFVVRGEIDYLRAIEKLINKRMAALKPPSAEEAHIARLKNAKAETYAVLGKTTIDNVEDEATEIANQYDAKLIAAALLHALSKDDERTRPVDIAQEKPLPHRHSSSDHGHNFRSGRSNGNRGRNGHSNGNRGGRRGGFKEEFVIDRGHKPADRRNQRIQARPKGVAKAAPKKREFKIVKKS
ncbi:ATP-dependent RNA helicase; cold shock [Oenococcus oeni]|uniref:DEAD/DEAH box helicase n=1 Tax=Oenococcus oeni TaxID=1247 RepID=UPI0008F930F6|nr:DEAD/DEAH box helicase [Oenococcus oeni]OIK85637.1 ATP-dependent RNA helicase [Oenococcus oeni]OIL07992.1 ATP-dependent RNA helicase [Oenococcus oeni]OIL11845.1 ATP-dependent RNA helicase [Oenococcus oeni]SYW06139.1 ATP-dependent RNA helicase; cold shock [Oenococcus oeni]SYW12103.1 ATP-dependent RNA helicase; cold shock [Oenococcus oeni]